VGGGKGGTRLAVRAWLIVISILLKILVNTYVSSASPIHVKWRQSMNAPFTRITFSGPRIEGFIIMK
jgi:hypothetical protein